MGRGVSTRARALWLTCDGYTRAEEGGGRWDMRHAFEHLIKNKGANNGAEHETDNGVEPERCASKHLIEKR